MRNVFDQYSQPENRVTHALLTALDQDRSLLASFIKFVGVKPPRNAKQLSVLEQQYPGEAEPSEDKLESRGIPDGWIYDEGASWCVFIETKVLAALRPSQVETHRQTAIRRGFRVVKPVVIVPRTSSVTMPADVKVLEWRNVYAWLQTHASKSAWAKHVAEYLEIAEAKMIENGQFVEGTLTKFAGFPFDFEHPYTYLEGKRLLKLSREELSGRRDLRNALGMNPNIEGRSAITGSRSDAVWDFLSLSSASDAHKFTRYPHLTIGITAQAIEAMVTIPNGVNPKMRRKIRDQGEDGFQKIVSHIVQNARPLTKKHKGATPWFRGVQRRYPSQRAAAFIDARIDFDLRTAVPFSGDPKLQSSWLSAAYNAFTNKKGANYQIQVGVIFRYDRCPSLKSAEATALISDAWLACKPLIDLGKS